MSRRNPSPAIFKFPNGPADKKRETYGTPIGRERTRNRKARPFGANDPASPSFHLFPKSRKVFRDFAELVQHAGVSRIAPAMAVYHLFGGGRFDAEHVAAMSLALGVLSNEFGLNPHDEHLRQMIARAILSCAHRGIRNHTEIRKCARAILKNAA